jgi:hypothetical protein
LNLTVKVVSLVAIPVALYGVSQLGRASERRRAADDSRAACRGAFAPDLPQDADETERGAVELGRSTERSGPTSPAGASNP